MSAPPKDPESPDGPGNAVSASLLRTCVIGPVPPIKGGISQHTARLATAASDLGPVEVITWQSQYPGVLYGRDQIDRAATPYPARAILRWWSPASWVRAGTIARRADLVVLPWVVPVQALAYLVIMTICRRSIRVVHVHNPVPHERMPLDALLSRVVLGMADHLVCHAQSILEEVRTLGITTPTAVTPMPPLLTVPRTPIPPPPVRFLCIGAIRDYKGVDLAIEAFAQRRRAGADIRLTVAGEVWGDTVDPRAIALRAGVGDGVDFELGYLSDDRVAELLSRSHCVLAPYRSATQSGAVSLALAAARPVVVTAVGGLQELIRDGENGIVAEAATVDAVARAMMAVEHRIGDLALHASSIRHDWGGYAEILRDIANGGKAPSPLPTTGTVGVGAARARPRHGVTRRRGTPPKELTEISTRLPSLVTQAIGFIGHRVHVLRPAETRQVLSHAGPLVGRRVLDVAGGDGYWASRITDRGAEALCLDLAFGKLHRGRGYTPRPGLVQGDALSLPFPDESFDAVVSVCALEHFPSGSGALEEIARVLRPGGVLSLSADALTEGDRWPRRLEAHRRRYHVVETWDHERLTQAFTDAGLEPTGWQYLFRGRRAQWLYLQLSRWRWAWNVAAPLGPAIARLDNRSDATGAVVVAAARKRP